MRKVIGMVLMLALVLGAQYMAWRERSAVAVSTLVVADNPTHFYRAAGEARGVVLVAHGYAASKEVMRPWGYFLAQQGFDTYIVDQPGHGDSKRPLPVWRSAQGTPLGDNLRAVVDELIRSGKAQPGRVALIGHSMGGFTVTQAALAEPRVGATVAISSPYTEPLPADQPKHYLGIAAERDPAFILQAFRAESQAQSVPAATGSGRQFALVAGRNHMTILYDTAVMAQASAWIAKAFGAPAVPAREAPFGWPWVWLALAGGLGLVVALMALLADSGAWRRGVRSQARIGLTAGMIILAVAALSAVLAVVYLRLPWLGLAVVDYLLPYFLVMAAVLLALRLVWPRDFGFAVVTDPNVAGGVLRGVAIFLGFMGAVAPVVQMNLSSYMPTAGRILPLLFLALGLWLYFAQEEGLKRTVAEGLGAWSGVLVGVVGKLVILLTWYGSSALPNPQPFLPLVIPVALSLFALLEASSYFMHRWRHPAVTAATFSALVMAWSLAVSMPLV